VPVSNQGIGIENVRKRLSIIYPKEHELKLSDEGNFFVVSLLLSLKTSSTGAAIQPASPLKSETVAV
jgi:sensor histidine kinase YesM